MISNKLTLANDMSEDYISESILSTAVDVLSIVVACAAKPNATAILAIVYIYDYKVDTKFNFQSNYWGFGVLGFWGFGFRV